jgi:hypothetical protein
MHGLCPPSREPFAIGAKGYMPCVIAIREVAKRFNELRKRWLNRESATEAELK